MENAKHVQAPVTIDRTTTRWMTLWIAGALACAVALAGAKPATGDPGYPFTPSLSVTASANAAGAHPSEFTIRVEKPPNGCDPQDPDTKADYTDTYLTCPVADVEAAGLEQQDLKRLVMTLPSGLVADPDAAPGCEGESLECPAESQVGTVTGYLSNCTPNTWGSPTASCGWSPNLTEPALLTVGGIYMGVPRPGEQARLVALIGASWPSIPYEMPNLERVEMSVTVDRSGWITTVTDGMPDLVGQWGDAPVMAQVYEMALTLWGETGLEDGRPLISNPTSCSGKAFAGEAQGYAYNVYRDEQNDSQPGYGDGTTVPISAEYPVRHCNSIPYEPKLDLSFDLTAANAAPAISAALTQGAGEQTTGSAKIKFPKGFRINLDNKLAQCAEDQFPDGCPAESAIGTATADSDLLPAGTGPVGGAVYLGPTDLAAGTVKLMANLSNDWLPDGIDVTGTATLNADGTAEATFDDLPELPVKSFTLSLEGGSEKALLRLPKACGPYTIESKLTSHQGTQATADHPLDVPCEGEASFGVELGTRRAGARPTVTLTAAAPRIEGLSFRLPSGLRVARRLASGRSYGELTFTTADGATATKLVPLSRPRDGRTTPLSATENGTQVAGLSFAHGKVGARGKAKTISLSRIPGDTTQVALALTGGRRSLVGLPKTCRSGKRKRSKAKRRKLRFSAAITGAGRSFEPSYETQMACGGGKSKRKKGR